MAFYIERYHDLERKEYEIEVVTPMFLGGADPKKAEIRAPSFKGMLRFWWRAINPQFAKNDPYKNFFLEESKLFGDSEKTGRSKVVFEIKLENIPRKISYSLLPHKNLGKTEAIENGFRFKLQLTASEDIHVLFELSSILGGVGKRSRRGFGSFRLIKQDNPKIDTEYIKSLIKNSLYVLKQDAIYIVENDIKSKYPFVKKVQIGREKNYFHDILVQIGKSSHDNNSDFTGFAKDKKRFASPIYVSVVKNEKYSPIITTLNCSFAEDYNRGKDKSESFINGIIS